MTLERAASLLRCPDHAGRLVGGTRSLGCPACDFSLTWQRGRILTRGRERGRDSTALRLMRSRLVSRIYERLWRPVLVRAVSRLGYDTEDAIVDRHVAVRPGLEVLELCCGTARAGRRWVERGAEVLGVDRSMQMLEEARRQCGDDRLILLRGDAGRQLQQADAFDAALCFAALHLLAEPAAAIRAAVTSLRPGGVFAAWALSATGILRRSAPALSLLRAAGLRPFEAGGLRRALDGAGLEIVESLVDGAVELVVGRRPRGRVEDAALTPAAAASAGATTPTRRVPAGSAPRWRR